MSLNWSNLKQTEKIGIAVVSGLLMFFLFNPFNSNTTNFQGSVINPQENNQDSEPQKIECQANNEFLTLADNLNLAIESLNRTGIVPGQSDEQIKIIAEGVASMLSSLEAAQSVTDCVVVQSVNIESIPFLKNLRLNELIGVLNGSIAEINLKILTCTDCKIAQLKLISEDYSCPEGQILDSDSFQCNVPIIRECKFVKEYNAVVEANNLLIRYRNNPNGFDINRQIELRELLNQISPVIFKQYNTGINYLSEAELMSQNLARIADRIVNSGQEYCSELALVNILQLNMTMPPSSTSTEQVENLLNGGSPTSCQAGAIYDEVVQDCYCPLSDSFIGFSATCSQGASNDDAEINLQSITDDKLVELMNEEGLDADFESELNDLFGSPTDTTNAEQDTEDVGTVEIGTVETPSVTTPPRAPENSLVSNTNANVLESGEVKGSTGPNSLLGLYLIIMFLSLGLVYKFTN